VDSELVKEAGRLRSRARWFRAFARLGNPALRANREALAEKFDRMAEDAEKRANET